jgi:hypothetical protein
MSAEHTPATKTKHRVSRPAGKPEQEESDRTGPRDGSSLDDSKLYGTQPARVPETSTGGGPRPAQSFAERVKFLSIVSSNLDEFFMVRVAGLKRQVESSVLACNPDGMTPRQQSGAIREKASDLFKAAHECLSRQICPALKKAGLCVLDAYSGACE